MANWPLEFRYARPFQRRVTKTANFGPLASGAYQDVTTDPQDTAKPDVVSQIAQFDACVIVLVVHTAARPAAETYDIYVTGGLQKTDSTNGPFVTDAKPIRWDVVHFPQIAAAVVAGTPKIYAARVNGVIFPQSVTTASPGVAANDPAVLDISAPASVQGIKTLTAGDVRHGYWGDHLTHELVVSAGSPSIDYEIWVAMAAL